MWPLAARALQDLASRLRSGRLRFFVAASVALPTSRINESAAFDPQAVKALAAAYDDACAVLHVVDRADPRATTVAKKIIEHAQHGERDPIRLRDLVLIELQSNPETA